MKNEEHEFVDRLLEGLPKAPPRTKIEQRRMEKFIDEQIATLKVERAQAHKSIYLRFQSQFQLAAGFLVVVGGVAFALNYSGTSSTSIVAQPTPAASPTNSVATPAPSETASNNAGQNSGTGNSGSEFFENETKSPNSVPNIFNTGLDYSTSLAVAKARITPKLAPISLGAMSPGDKNCVIKQGVDEVLAIDHAKYDGQKSTIIYFKNVAGLLRLLVVDTACNKITTLE